MDWDVDEMLYIDIYKLINSIEFMEFKYVKQYEIVDLLVGHLINTLDDGFKGDGENECENKIVENKGWGGVNEVAKETCGVNGGEKEDNG
ncbi:hypothetical protein CR513_00112, partial [Mucuna pruriens]